MSLDYVGKCRGCGCVLAASSLWLSENAEDDFRKSINSMLRYGLSIERMESEDVRTTSWNHADDCPNKPQPKKRKKNKNERSLFT
jgi:hypothetical protein